MSLPSSFTRHFTHLSLSDNTAFCLVIYPSSNTFPRTVHCLLFCYSTEALCPCFCSPLPTSFSLPFCSLPSCFFFFPISIPLPCLTHPHPPNRPSLIQCYPLWLKWLWQMYPRPQTSASPVPVASLSADQTNGSNSQKLAVLTGAFMCSWTARPEKSGLNMPQTHGACTGYPMGQTESLCC